MSQNKISARIGPESHTGKEISGWQLKTLLANGTFSCVYTAQHKETGQLAAIKITDKWRCSTEDVARVWAEIKIQQQLKHSNIIELYEVIETPQYIYMVTQLAQEGDLLDHLNDRGSLTEHEASNIFLKLLLAMEYAHKKGFIHRDIKPENIFMDNGDILLGDWGFAGTYCPTKMQTADMGSLQYCSPEIIRGKSYCGPEVDVWSLGVVLYALVTRRLPFGGSKTEIVHKTCHGDFYMPPSLSSQLKKLLSCMLCPNRKNRATIQEIKYSGWLQLFHPHLRSFGKSKSSVALLTTNPKKEKKIAAHKTKKVGGSAILTSSSSSLEGYSLSRGAAIEL